MTLELVLPGLVAVACGGLAGVVPWSLRPMVAVRLLTAAAGVVAVTVVVVLATVTAGFVARLSVVASVIEWCPVVPVHHEVGAVEGMGATLALVIVVWRARRVGARWRSAASGTAGRRLWVLDETAPIAYAAPGEPGCVVVSRGLLDLLEPAERNVVLTHERAHLHLGHHRYLLVADLAVAAVPLLAPLRGQIRTATERSADEAAVVAAGGDRRLVARTIVRAALGGAGSAGILPAIGGGSVATRVRALVDPPQRRAIAAGALVACGAAVAATSAAGAVQAHHIAELVAHICG